VDQAKANQDESSIWAQCPKQNAGFDCGACSDVTVSCVMGTCQACLDCADAGGGDAGGRGD
jgi:hypothetical protein